MSEASFSLADQAEADKAGAKAGARARRRERAESDSQIAAVIAAERGETDRAVWESTYTAEGIRRTLRHRETARQTLTPAELLSEARRAVRIAAARLESRHGIPELSGDERADLVSELVTRILSETSAEAGADDPAEQKRRLDRAPMPRREKMTRAYLSQRAAGIVLDDPERANTEAGENGDPDLADIAADAEARERSRKSAADPMLNAGTDGEWPELAAAAAILGVSESKGRPKAGAPPMAARRAASYLVTGGTLLAKPTDCPKVWGITPKSAAQVIVPRGAEWLRTPENARRYAAAIRMARLLDLDDLDHWHARREWIRRGVNSAPRPPRAVKVRRERTELDPADHAPVKVRTDKRIIRSAERRAADARRAGWTEAGA